ncbi:Os02g0538400 [Oryza sativa Japonica Group]|uniref:Os02g0538400 protein n=1 Tax=Oryza sativa subsp. japonica TaxID=39947 RepID=A0A0P0VK33_ORYSJ|nr:Os02g0538400 [Oryza sativa Japonica Group]
MAIAEGEAAHGVFAYAAAADSASADDPMTVKMLRDAAADVVSSSTATRIHLFREILPPLLSRGSDSALFVAQLIRFIFRTLPVYDDQASNNAVDDLVQLALRKPTFLGHFAFMLVETMEQNMKFSRPPLLSDVHKMYVEKGISTILQVDTRFCDDLFILVFRIQDILRLVQHSDEQMRADALVIVGTLIIKSTDPETLTTMLDAITTSLGGSKEELSNTYKRIGMIKALAELSTSPAVHQINTVAASISGFLMTCYKDDGIKQVKMAILSALGSLSSASAEAVQPDLVSFITTGLKDEVCLRKGYLELLRAVCKNSAALRKITSLLDQLVQLLIISFTSTTQRLDGIYTLFAVSRIVAVDTDASLPTICSAIYDACGQVDLFTLICQNELSSNSALSRLQRVLKHHQIVFIDLIATNMSAIFMELLRQDDSLTCDEYALEARLHSLRTVAAILPNNGLPEFEARSAEPSEAANAPPTVSVPAGSNATHPVTPVPQPPAPAADQLQDMIPMQKEAFISLLKAISTSAASATATIAIFVVSYPIKWPDKVSVNYQMILEALLFVFFPLALLATGLSHAAEKDERWLGLASALVLFEFFYALALGGGISIAIQVRPRIAVCATVFSSMVVITFAWSLMFSHPENQVVTIAGYYSKQQFLKKMHFWARHPDMPTGDMPQSPRSSLSKLFKWFKKESSAPSQESVTEQVMPQPSFRSKFIEWLKRSPPPVNLCDGRVPSRVAAGGRWPAMPARQEGRRPAARAVGGVVAGGPCGGGAVAGDAHAVGGVVAA